MESIVCIDCGAEAETGLRASKKLGWTEDEFGWICPDDSKRRADIQAVDEELGATSELGGTFAEMLGVGFAEVELVRDENGAIGEQELDAQRKRELVETQLAKAEETP